MKKDRKETWRRKFYKWMAKKHPDTIIPMQKCTIRGDDFFIRTHDPYYLRVDKWGCVWDIRTAKPCELGHPSHRAKRSNMLDWYREDCQKARKAYEEKRKKEESQKRRALKRVEELSLFNPKICEEKPFFETIAFLGAIKGKEREKGRDMGMEGGL